MSDAEHHAGHPSEPSDALVNAADAVTASPSPTPRKTPDQMALESLAPQYDEDQHKTYLDHLEAVLSDAKNRNIALTGWYGTGKSSVLDKFQERHEKSVLRLAVSTLAPEKDATLTNRIQKEVLKQLVYSARPRTLRHSRFSHRGPLAWWRAWVESALFVGWLWGLLALLGHLPSQIATGVDHSGAERAVAWVAIAILLVVVFAVLRMITYNRFVISNVSAAGATLTLSVSNHSYFDEYLDEIIYFFDQEPVDIVLFEDLDRYDDPQIFQALRELNTLLNNTPQRLRKITKNKKPLRFVYAVRDSLFEKIGDVAAKDGNDAARTETARANRTKFFDVVIPVVPFISHRTAREHLHRLLQEACVTDIDRALVEVVAKHATDMRLLLNMRNEYLVFAERLLQSDKVAPELSPSHLFALIAYKNFHMADFEDIARRSSDLDRLYDYHRELVATSVAGREQSKRALLAKTQRPAAIGPFVRRLGKRLVALGEAERDRVGWSNWPLSFSVGSGQYNSDGVTKPQFWEAVIEARAVTVQAMSNPSSANPIIGLSQVHLEGLFPEILQERWEEKNITAIHEEVHQLDRDIEELRRADFCDLITADKFRLTVCLTSEDEAARTGREATTAAEDLTFGELVDGTLTSGLARDLVKHGYIDRNFTLYAAQFYGDFTGVDVATFIVRTVQTNTMDVNHQFTSPGAFANLLAETDEDFTRTVSAYNVQLVDYLLAEDVPRADEVVEHLTSHFGNNAEQFLAAFFTSNVRRTRLAARLSHKPWRDVFTYLVSSDGVPADVRIALVDAALLATRHASAYDLGPDVGDFILAHYQEMTAFTEPHPPDELDTVVAMLERAQVLLPSLGIVHERLRTLIVDNNLYELTAQNLRTALDINGQVTLDEIRHNDAVYQYCLSNLSAYLGAIEADGDTDYSTQTPQTLIDALTAAETDTTTLEQLTTTASPDSLLPQLTDAPTSTWPALAAAKLFHASLANLDVYRAEAGEIDASLGALLLDAGAIDTDEGDTTQSREENDDTHAAAKNVAAVAVLNAQRGIPRPTDRVRLVRSLGLGGPLPATQITPEQSTLFALLLKHGLVPDDAATFTHLHPTGWNAVRPAIIASNGITRFLTPDLVNGMIADLFNDPETSRKIGSLALDALAAFVPTDDRKALAAAAGFAIRNNTVLPVDQIRRITTTNKNAGLTVALLQIAAPIASDVMTVLNELGGVYSYLATWEPGEFEVPYDEAHRAVFKILADDNVCRTSKKPRKDILVVKRP